MSIVVTAAQLTKDGQGHGKVTARLEVVQGHLSLWVTLASATAKAWTAL